MPPDTPAERIETLNEGIEAAIESDELQQWSEESGNTIFFEGADYAKGLMG
jgi:tripartite-type tricarboxylate transporter receptor subunit TctC